LDLRLLSSKRFAAVTLLVTAHVWSTSIPDITHIKQKERKNKKKTYFAEYLCSAAATTSRSFLRWSVDMRSKSSTQRCKSFFSLFKKERKQVNQTFNQQQQQNAETCLASPVAQNKKKKRKVREENTKD
jgi:hypothetical protein